MPTPIGGWSVPSSGGWITVQQLNADFTLGASTASSGSDYGAKPKVIDVQLWRYKMQYREKTLAMSGLMGVPATRRTAEFFDFELQVLWDPSNPPEIVMRKKSGFSLNLLLGNCYALMCAAFGQNVNAPQVYENSQIYPKQWYFPLVKCVDIAPLVVPKEYKLIGETITGRSVSHGFILPDDNNATMGAYLTYLNNMQTALLR